MKRFLVVVAISGLVVGSVTTAEAAKKPQKVELFLHGTEMIGEIDLANNFAVGYNAMNTAKPTDAVPKSITGIFWKEQFNDCAGMFGLPVWVGPVAGHIKGDMTLTLHKISGPRRLEVEIWPDVGTQTCASNDLSEGTYPEPAAMTTVDLPPGQGAVEVVLENVNFKARGTVLLQLTSVGGPASARILYDSPDFASSLAFSCIPSSGSKCSS